MRIVHHLNFRPVYSGMDHRVFSMVKRGNEIGQDRAICFTTSKKPQYYLVRGSNKPFVSIAPEEAEKADVNIFHRILPDNFNSLKNRVFFAHGTPQYVKEEIERLSSVARYIKLCDLTLTSWPSHMQYWQQFTDKPVLYNQPGADLTVYTSNGNKAYPEGFELPHPNILWADEWRGGKDPYNLLYGLKIAAKEAPNVTLRILNVQQGKDREQLFYMIGSLGLDNVVMFPIEYKVPNIADYYRAADSVFCADPEGNNVSWEALACGRPVIYNSSPTAIAEQLLSKMPLRGLQTPLNIDDTLKEQEAIFRERFKLP